MSRRKPSAARRAARAITVTPATKDSPRPSTTADAPVNASAEQKKKRIAVLWNASKVAGPAVIAVAALVISGLAYNDQHRADAAQNQADIAAEVAGEQAYADQVSFWLVPTGNARVFKLAIQNRNPVPISSVYAQNTVGPSSDVNLPFNAQINDALSTLSYVPLGIIPPCSIVTTAALEIAADDEAKVISRSEDLPSKTRSALMKPGAIGVNIFSLQFTDPNGMIWSRNFNGQLTKPKTLAPGTNGVKVYISIPAGSAVSPANACA